MREVGCPVGEDIATDEELNSKVMRFLTAKSLYRATEDPQVARATFEKLGLYSDPDLHLQLEAIYSEWLQIQQRNKSRQQRGTS